MKKKLFLLTLLTTPACNVIAIPTTAHRKAEILVEHCYSNKGLTPAEEASIHDLIVALEKTPPFEQARMASEAQTTLHKTIHDLKKQITLQMPLAEKKRIELQLLLAKIQEKHLERFSFLTLASLPGYKKAFEKGKLWVNSTFGTKNDYLTRTTQQLIAYMHLERDRFLTNPDTIISFFHAQDNSSLPKIMKFWWFRPEQLKIIQLAKKAAACVMPCADAIGALIEGGEEAAEGLEVENIAGTTEKLGIGGDVDTTTITADVSQVEEMNTAAAPLTNQSTALKKIDTIAEQRITKSITEADPAEDLGLPNVSAGNSTTPKRLPLDDQILKHSQVTQKLAASVDQETAKTTNEITQTQGVLNSIKNTWHKGLIGNAEDVLTNTANRLQTALGKLEKKYPDSGAINALSQVFKASRTLFGVVYKFTPLGIAKWLEASPTGKMLYDMLKLSLVMSGSSMYNAWINQQTFAAWAKIRQLEIQIASGMQTITSNIQAAFTVKNAQLATSFQTRLAQMSQNQTAIQSINNEELNYLNNAITASTMQQMYLSVPMYNDKLFELSTMLTPPPITTSISNSSPQITQSNWQTAVNMPFQQQALGSWTGPLVATKKETILNATGQTSNNNFGTNLVAGLQTKIETILPTIPPQAPAYPTWHNIFRRGNWEFMVTQTNNGYQGTFAQHTIVPLDTTANATTPIFLQAIYNSIFSQHIPAAFYYRGVETHIIQIACTINKVSYPFFMGFYFNGGRWISGVDQLRYQRRTLGVLGSAKGNSSIWFGETFYLQPQQALQQQVNAIWPLWQFFRASTQDSAVWQQQNPAANIATKPLYTESTSKNGTPCIVPGTTIIFTVATQPTQVTISAHIQGSSTPLIDNMTVANLNPKTYMYHNIGLISAGCSASFTITHPQSLTYPQAALSALFKEVQ